MLLSPRLFTTCILELSKEALVIFQQLVKGFSLVSFSLVVSFSVSCSQSGQTESPETVVVSEDVLAQSNNIETEDALAKQVVEAEQAWAAAFQSCDADALTTLTTEDFSFYRLQRYDLCAALVSRDSRGLYS